MFGAVAMKTALLSGLSVGSRPHLFRLSRSWSLVALLAACSGSEPGPGGGTTSLKTPASFCQAWGKAACNAEVVDACGGDDVDACVASQQSFCLDLLPYGYDPKYAQECLDAVEDAYADADLNAEELGVVLQLAAPCDRLIKGSGDVGENCSEDTDCNTLADLRCVIKTGQAQGTCQVPVEVGGGDPCDGPDQICSSNYYCDGENCIRQKALGAECLYDDECSDEHRCDSTLDDAGERVPGVCVERIADSEPCTSDAECQSHLCPIARTATEGVCVSDLPLSPPIPLCENLR